MMTELAKSDPSPDLDPQVYLDSATNRLNAQLGSIDAIDGKASTVLATALAEVALVAAVAMIHPLGEMALPIATAAAGLVAALACLAVLIVRKWKTFPSAKSVWELYDGEADARLQVGSTLSQAAEANTRKLERKTCLLSAAMVLVVIETALFAVSALRPLG